VREVWAHVGRSVWVAVGHSVGRSVWVGLFIVEGWCESCGRCAALCLCVGVCLSAVARGGAVSVSVVGGGTICLYGPLWGALVRCVWRCGCEKRLRAVVCGRRYGEVCVWGGPLRVGCLALVGAGRALERVWARSLGPD
jgi:hypothetical protein